MDELIKTKETIRVLLVTTMMSLCVGSTALVCSAQIGRVPTPARTDSRTKVVAPRKAASALELNFLQPEKNKETNKPIDFGSVPLGLVGLRTIAVDSIGSMTIDIKDSNGADPSPVYKYELDQTTCEAKPDTSKSEQHTSCQIVVGFMPSDDHSVVTAQLTITNNNGQKYGPYDLTGRGSSSACLSAKSFFLPLNRGLKTGEDYPDLDSVPTDAANQLYKDFGDPLKKLLVNCFYSTNSLFSYFNQFQSIYNSASGSATLNAQLGSLNFTNGMQINVGTNPQVGASSSTSSSTASTSALRLFSHSIAVSNAATASAPPTLSATSAAQATQNILNGGTVYAADIFPVLFRRSTYSIVTVSTAAKEGIDFQTFNNTSTTATNPKTHTFVGLQGYFQLTSSNDAADSSGPAGSIFLGGSYGYSLMNHSYSAQYGFGGRVNSQIAQVSAGILLNGVVKIAAYRGFGPSQKYVDSTSMAQKTVNNFQTWSIAIAYQSSGSGKSK